MKVTAFVASARKKFTYDATERFLEKLQACGNVEYEIVVLSEYKLGVCTGCQACMSKGEEFCPLKDDRDMLLAKIAESDAVVFATPNYAFQVSAFLKILLDRMGFLIHRPRYFKKVFTAIVAQGIYGGADILKYLDFVSNSLGFTSVKGSCVTRLDPPSEKVKEKVEKQIEAHAKRFYSKMQKASLPAPSLIKLMAFRMSRTSMNKMLDEKAKDYRYFSANGWFLSDYYYPVKMGPVMKMFGRFFDRVAARMFS